MPRAETPCAYYLDRYTPPHGTACSPGTPAPRARHRELRRARRLALWAAPSLPSSARPSLARSTPAHVLRRRRPDAPRRHPRTLRRVQLHEAWSMMRTLVERENARKLQGLMDAIVRRVATRIIEAPAARVEPVVAAAVERCLARSGRLPATPRPWDEQARSNTVGVEEGPFLSGWDTEKTESLAGQERRSATPPCASSCGSASVGTPATSRADGAPSTRRSNVDAVQRTS
jgi:hypothetical protein